MNNSEKRGMPTNLDRWSLRADEAYKGMVEEPRPLPASKPERPKRGGLGGQWNNRVYGGKS